MPRRRQIANRFGSNVLPSAKRKGVLRRLAGAFVNPFTAILFALALVSVFTDIVFVAGGRAELW